MRVCPNPGAEIGPTGGGEDISIVISDLSSLPPALTAEDSEGDVDQEHSETLINRLEELVGELEEEIVKRNSWILFLSSRNTPDIVDNFNPNSFVQGLHSIYHSLDNLKAIVQKYESLISKQLAELFEKEAIVNAKESQIQSVAKDNGRLLKKIQVYQQDISKLLISSELERASEMAAILGEKNQKIQELEDFFHHPEDPARHGHSSEHELYEKIMRLEQRLTRAHANGQSADMDHYMRKLEKHTHMLEKQRASMLIDIDSLKCDLIRSKIKDKECFIGWTDLHPRLHENCPELAQFLTSLNQECKSLRKTLIQHTHQMSTDSDNEPRLFPGRTSISLLEREFSHDMDDVDSDVFSTCSQQSPSPILLEDVQPSLSTSKSVMLLFPSHSNYGDVPMGGGDVPAVKNPRNRHFSFS